MFERIRNLFSLDESKERSDYRISLARAMILIAWLLLVVYIVGDLAYLRSLIVPNPFSFVVELLSILALAAMGLVAWLLVRAGKVVTGGYVLSVGLFLTSALSLGLFPGDLFVQITGFLFSILTAGSIIGGASGYLFAIGAIVVLVLDWVTSGAVIVFTDAGEASLASLSFLAGQSAAYLGLAVVLDLLSRNFAGIIQQLRIHAERLTELANTDPLTNLANRRQMSEKLQQEFARSRRYNHPLSLLYLDLDGFKTINDRFGHLFGDDVLIGASKAMQGVLRATDLLVRVGGDEFAVLLPETNLEGGREVAVKLRDALAAYARSLGPTVPELSFCAGVSQLLDEDLSGDEIITRADMAQYLAKSAGQAHIRTQRGLAEPISASRG
ncbi:MAG TPA: diguanylate cyclase [Anaerolineales bacterium]|nr:diguanylate cyclase [Anaerolineales bacterium]